MNHTPRRCTHRVLHAAIEPLESRRMLATSVVSGSARVDSNHNGTLDAGEPASPGNTLFVDLNRNAQLDSGEPSAVSGADGKYTLTTVPTGKVVIRIVPISG